MGENLKEICKFIQQSAPVVVTSCIGAFQLLDTNSDSQEERQQPQFSIVVVDEAAQTTEPALLCALAASRAEQVVLVGDTRQLPPTVASEDAKLRAKLGTSPMERLEAIVERRILRVQYRMPPSLLEHPSSYFYDGMVTSAPHLVMAAANTNSVLPRGFSWPNENIPLAFVNVCGDSCGLEIMHEFGGKSNPTEAKLIASIVADFLDAGKLGDRRTSRKDIAIISPYSKQVQLIQNELVKRNIYEVQVGTVDSFQGQETSVVCFSAVRSNSLKEMGFLRDPRRLCVSLTRAKHGLVVVGDARTLNSCRHWSALLNSCRARGCFMHAKDVHAQQQTEDIIDSATVSLLPDSIEERMCNETQVEKFVFEGIDLFA